MLHDLFRIQVRMSSAAPVVMGGSSIGMVNVPRPVLMGVSDHFPLSRCWTLTRTQGFEQLAQFGLFVPTMAPSAGLAKQFVKHRCTVEREDLRIAVERMGQTNMKKWFSKAQ